MVVPAIQPSSPAQPPSESNPADPFYAEKMDAAMQIVAQIKEVLANTSALQPQNPDGN